MRQHQNDHFWKIFLIFIIPIFIGIFLYALIQANSFFSEFKSGTPYVVFPGVEQLVVTFALLTLVVLFFGKIRKKFYKNKVAAFLILAYVSFIFFVPFGELLLNKPYINFIENEHGYELCLKKTYKRANYRFNNPDSRTYYYLANKEIGCSFFTDEILLLPKTELYLLLKSENKKINRPKFLPDWD